MSSSWHRHGLLREGITDGCFIYQLLLSRSERPLVGFKWACPLLVIDWVGGNGFSYGCTVSTTLRTISTTVRSSTLKQ